MTLAALGASHYGDFLAAFAHWEKFHRRFLRRMVVASPAEMMLSDVLLEPQHSVPASSLVLSVLRAWK
jgi:hypothetical protein